MITEDPIEDELAADELLLARDVLDTQIFDLGGRRLTRVADIELAWRDREVRVVGVDIGAALVAAPSRSRCLRAAGGGQDHPVERVPPHLRARP